MKKINSGITSNNHFTDTSSSSSVDSGYVKTELYQGLPTSTEDRPVSVSSDVYSVKVEKNAIQKIRHTNSSTKQSEIRSLNERIKNICG